MSGGCASRQKGNRTDCHRSRFTKPRFCDRTRAVVRRCSRSFRRRRIGPLLGVDRRVEVKVRGNGFRRLYDWLGDHDFLIVKADRLEPLVVLRLKFASEIAVLAEQTKNSCKKQASPDVSGN